MEFLPLLASLCYCIHYHLVLHIKHRTLLLCDCLGKTSLDYLFKFATLIMVYTICLERSMKLKYAGDGTNNTHTHEICTLTLPKFYPYLSGYSFQYPK